MLAIISCKANNLHSLNRIALLLFVGVNDRVMHPVIDDGQMGIDGRVGNHHVLGSFDAVRRKVPQCRHAAGDGKVSDILSPFNRDGENGN